MSTDLYQRGRIWWACLYRDGRRIRESLKTADKAVAEKRLAQLKRTRERGAYLAPHERKVHVSELLDDLLVHLELKGAASVRTVRSHLKAVRDELGHLKAPELDTATVERVQALWRRTVAPATVNRRCEALRQAYRLASRRTPPKVKVVPHIPMLRVDNARQGFLSRADFEALREHLADEDVRDFIDWFWWTAMRPGEIRQLTWEMLDREDGTLNLDPRAAKTRRGRVLALEGPLAEIMEHRTKRRRLDCPLIFHRTSKGQHGQPVLDIRKQWKAALKAAHLPPGLLPYDLRRSAIRNMVRGGTKESVAMKISGHQTRSTFDRYNIVDETDVREAVIATAAYVAEQPKKRKVGRIRGKRDER